MATLYRCNYCDTYLAEEPEVRTSGNPHAKNVCPCGKELESRSDYSAEYVSESTYVNTPKQHCKPNYLH